MTTPANILYPQPPPLAQRLCLPPIAGVLIYTIIRIIADSNNNGFIDWARPLWLFALECGWTIGSVFVIHEMTIWLRLWLYKRVFEQSDPKQIISHSAYLLREIQWIFVATLLAGNALGLPFTAMTDDGLSFFDGFVNNLVTIVFLTAYLLATRGRDYVRLFNQVEIERERYKQESATARFQALQHQLNPHFLFNSLNTLSSLVHRDADAADKFIRELAKVYRYVLEAGEHDSVSLNEELKFLDSYLYLLKTRFKEALLVNVHICDEHLEKRVPPMTLQVLLENAVKHNIVSAKQPLVCSISSHDDSSLAVRNALQERSEKDASSSIGLANLQARYEYLHKGKSPVKPVVFVGEEEFTVVVPLLD